MSSGSNGMSASYAMDVGETASAGRVLAEQAERLESAYGIGPLQGLSSAAVVTRATEQVVAAWQRDVRAWQTSLMGLGTGTQRAADLVGAAEEQNRARWRAIDIAVTP